MTQTINVPLQSRQPGSYTVGPGNIPNGTQTAQFVMSGSAIIPPGCDVILRLFLSWDNRKTWDQVYGAELTGGDVPNGYSATVPIEGAGDYEVTIDISGTACTLGGSLTLS